MKERSAPESRREFLKQAGRLGAVLCLASTRLFPLRKASMDRVADTVPAFRSRSVSLRHLPEMREWMAKMDWSGRLSQNKTWRGHVRTFQYGPSPELGRARSLIIMAAPLKISRIVFQPGGQKRAVLIPSGYVDDGNTLADYRNMLYGRGIVPAGSHLEPATLPLKLLAVRSGLATYGRNNLAFIEGYGSFHQLLAFYSEQPLQDQWGPLRLLRQCKGCSICLQSCPTGAIRRNDFIIDPDKCITLYNEVPVPMPAWIPVSAHNALVGCLKCQLTCPGNEDLIQDLWDLGEVPETETAALLSGRIDAKTAERLKGRFKRIGGGDDLAYIARNLRLVLAAPSRPSTSAPWSRPMASISSSSASAAANRTPGGWKPRP